MGIPSVRRIRSKTLFKGRVMRLTLDDYRTSSGQQFRRETIHHPASVVILPVLPDGRVVMIRQYRPAIRQYIHEISAGTSEPGEALAACAKRELAEETGYRAKIWKRLYEFYPAPGVSTERMVLYLAGGLSKLSRPVGKDKDEIITTVPVSAAAAVKLVRQNRVVDAKSIIGILMGLKRIRW